MVGEKQQEEEMGDDGLWCSIICILLVIVVTCAMMGEE